MKRMSRTIRMPESLDHAIEELAEARKTSYTDAMLLLLTYGTKVESYRGPLDDPAVRDQIDEEFRQMTYEGKVFEQLSAFSKSQLDALKSAVRMEEERRYGAKHEQNVF